MGNNAEQSKTSLEDLAQPEQILTAEEAEVVEGGIIIVNNKPENPIFYKMRDESQFDVIPPPDPSRTFDRSAWLV